MHVQQLEYVFSLEVYIVEKDDRLDVCSECRVLPERLKGIIPQVGEQLDSIPVAEIDGGRVGNNPDPARGYAEREQKRLQDVVEYCGRQIIRGSLEKSERYAVRSERIDDDDERCEEIRDLVLHLADKRRKEVNAAGTRGRRRKQSIPSLLSPCQRLIGEHLFGQGTSVGPVVFKQGGIELRQPCSELRRWVRYGHERQDISRREGMVQAGVDPEEQKESGEHDDCSLACARAVETS